MIRRSLSILLCAAMLTALCCQPALAASVTAQDVLESAVELLTTPQQTGQTKTMQANFGQIQATVAEETVGAGTLYTRTYTFPQETSVMMTRLEPEGTFNGEAWQIVVPGTVQSVRWLDEDTGQWTEVTSLSQVQDAAVLFLETTEAMAIVYAPAVYEARENEMIEELTQCAVRLRLGRTDQGVLISWQAADVPDQARVECLAVVSGTTLVDWDDPVQAESWKGLLLTGDNRWTYDGYFYRTPSTYYPTGENYFHRIPDPYISIKMLDVPDSYGAVVMSIATLDVMLELMNEDGYYPTYAFSTWLAEDYQIGAGYFDTRWNADMTLGLMTAYELYGIEEFRLYAVYNGQYWLSNIDTHSVTYTSNDGTISGLLLEDYWHASGGQTTHTSLNHQLAAVLMLYRLGDLTGDAAYTTYAERLLDGIRAVGTQWMKSDGDLWYRIDPDGTMTGTDYPTLTYDDMFKLQQYLQQTGRGADMVLNALMLSKRNWMQANGVTDYLK